MPDSRQLQIELERVPTNLNPPQLAHHVVFTRVAEEYLLEVGHFDLVELGARLREAETTGAEKVSIPFLVTHRFVLSKSSAGRFVQAGRELEEMIRRETGSQNADPARAEVASD